MYVCVCVCARHGTQLISSKNYRPESDDVVFEIMNVIDTTCLKQSKANVVMCAVRVMLHVASFLADESIRAQVFERVKTPLLTLLATGDHEVEYIVLCHIRLMLQVSLLLSKCIHAYVPVLYQVSIMRMYLCCTKYLIYKKTSAASRGARDFRPLVQTLLCEV